MHTNPHGGQYQVWLYTRLLFRYFGERILFRLSVAISVAVLLVLILMATILAAIIGGEEYSSIHRFGQYSWQSVLVQECLFAVLAIDAFVLIFCAKGAQVNGKFASHR